ncbi:MAG: DGQHR domain-containing protein [Flavobacteriales bacterium]
MDDSTRIALLGRLVSGKDLKSELNTRKKAYFFESVSKSLEEEYLNDGWELDKEFKTKMKFKKLKPVDVQFEDQVWSMFANLGFTFLNRDRQFALPYDKDGNTQQIDVFAKDDESIIVVECKAAQSNKRGDFKKELEAMKHKLGGLRKSIQAIFPGAKPKFKFILATKNYHVGPTDLSNLEALGGVHFDEEAINYYSEMFRQIGLAARYQLLGQLFEGQQIPEMDNTIPAIRGKMGAYTYYSFSIEPEKLLKIGYVLHRNKANKKMMPTYQRIIKRSRLKSVSEFIENGGYFPNSIIISLEAGKKDLQFDRANTQVKSAIADIGVLHLPKKYRSAFIIDGQHRLYGYSNSEFKSKNSIPVVAFVNLAREEQVKLFMQINENQKAVPKNLRNTLNSDLLWTSDSLLDQMRALKSRLSLELGENRESPLYDRVIIGENKKSTLRCVTTDTIIRAVGRTSFLGKVTKKSIETPGTFYRGDLDEAFEKLGSYMIKCYAYLAENLEDEWNKGEEGIAVINKGVYAFIMLMGDIVDYLIEENICTVKTSAKNMFEESQTYIDPVIQFYQDIKPNEIEELKSKHGSGGDTKYWRTLQLAVRDTHKEFNPEGLDEYLKKEAREYNTAAFKYIRDIETFFKEDFREKLESKFGHLWFKKGVPPQVAKKANELAFEKNLKIENPEEEVEDWDCLTIIAYRAIALKNWRDLFEEYYTRPGQEKISGGKDAKTLWMVELEKLRNENFHQYSVTEEEFDFIQSLHKWLIQNSTNE